MAASEDMRWCGVRMLRRALVLVAMGLVLTWSIAWLSAMLTHPRYETIQLVELAAPHRTIEIGTSIGGRSFELLRYDAPGELGLRVDAPLGQLPPLARRLNPALDSRVGTRGPEYIEARGWPWPALYAHVDGYRSGSSRWPPLTMHGAFEVATLRGVRNPITDTMLLPYLPHWPGLIANTLLVAGCLGALHLTLLSARRASRKLRRRCPACGYSRGGLAPDAPCPECGRAS